MRRAMRTPQGFKRSEYFVYFKPSATTEINHLETTITHNTHTCIKFLDLTPIIYSNVNYGCLQLNKSSFVD